MTTDALRWAVVLVWLVLVGVLVRSQLGTEQVSPGVAEVLEPVASAPGAADTEEAWMGVYMRDRKIGYTHHQFLPTADGYRIEEQSVLRATVLETAQTIRFSAGGTTGRDFALKEFDVSLKSGVGDLKVNGRVGARGISIDMDVGEETRTQELPLDGPIYLPVGARRSLWASGMAAGRRVQMRVFDPSTMQSQPVDLQVEERVALDWNGKKVDAWRVRESFHGIETKIWLDDQGRTLREEGPMGLVTIRESAEQAVSAGWGKDGGLDLMAAVAIPVKHPLAAPREQRSLVLKLGGESGLRPPDDDRQSYRDGVVRIVREDDAARASFVLPYAGREWAADLGATTFLQSDHPKVRAKAASILARETDARRAAVRLRKWVYENLEKTPVASIPNALQVLEMGRGDCNEHAVLFAALARAAGLPARVVAGAVYVDGVFLYHAWDEVWLGEQWWSVDAAFDQMPVDATHLKLVTGGPEEHIAMLPVIGRLSIEVLSEDATIGYEPQPPSESAVAWDRR